MYRTICTTLSIRWTYLSSFGKFVAQRAKYWKHRKLCMHFQKQIPLNLRADSTYNQADAPNIWKRDEVEKNIYFEKFSLSKRVRKHALRFFVIYFCKQKSYRDKEKTPRLSNWVIYAMNIERFLHTIGNIYPAILKADIELSSSIYRSLKCKTDY